MSWLMHRWQVWPWIDCKVWKSDAKKTFFSARTKINMQNSSQIPFHVAFLKVCHQSCRDLSWRREAVIFEVQFFFNNKTQSLSFYKCNLYLQVWFLNILERRRRIFLRCRWHNRFWGLRWRWGVVFSVWSRRSTCLEVLGK